MTHAQQKALARHRAAPPKRRLVIEPPLCPYCGVRSSYLADSSPVYHGRDYGPVYACIPCDARCGTHPDGRPLGTLANAELRRARGYVHGVFDLLWKQADRLYTGGSSGKLRHVARLRAYEWLSAHLGIHVDDCHVALFDLERCREAYRILLREKPTDASIRAWAKARRAQS